MTSPYLRALPLHRAITPAALLLAACGQPAMQPAATPMPEPVAVAIAPAPEAVKVASVEGITEYMLPNGLRVLLFPDPSKPTATVNVTYFVGSRHEAYGETGMAHLLEHLVFKGTPNHPNIPQELTEHGARPNGTTWFDRTNYFETFSATPENLAWALDLEADRMVNSFIAKKDLDSEMTVVRNEFESGENSPFRVLMQRTMSTAFDWHNYGNSTIGSRADLENVPIERLQGFYRKYYQPDNAMLVVAGKFDEAKTLDMIEEQFGRIPRPDRTGDMRIFPTYTLDPTQDGEREVTLRRVGDTKMLMAAYHVPPGAHEEFAAVDVLTRVLGDEPSGRLYKALVEPKKAASVRAFNFQLREPGVLLAMAEVREDGSLDVARKAMVDAMQGAANRPPTAEEVERAKTALIKQLELTLNNSERVALELSEWAATGDWRLMFIHRDRLQKVTPEQVAAAARTYLKPSNRTLGMFVPTQQPDRAEIPAAPDVAALVKDYKGNALLAQGEAFDPSPANIDARTTRFELPNGFEVALLPKETRGNTVAARITLRHGSEQALMGRATAGDFAGEMLMRGTQRLSRQQFKDELDRLKARVNINGSTTQAYAIVETTRENLPAVLRLVGEALRAPAFDAKEWEELKQERLASLESQKSEPTALGSTAFRRQLSPWPKGHPLYVPTLDEQVAMIEAVKLADARRFYNDFYGARNGQMAVVGDFDPAEITAIAREVFGGWNAKQPFQRIASPYRPVDAAVVKIETPDKANAFFLAGLPLNVSDESPDYAGLVLGNYIMGGGFLNSRLATRIRQKEGISYGVGSQFFASAQDDRGQWMTYAIYAPENIVRLEEAFQDEVAKMLREGLTPEEVQAAKDGYLQTRQVSRAQDAGLAGTLVNDLYLDRTMAFDAALEAQIAALTAEQVNAAMRRHIDPNRIVVVKAGDFANKPPKPAPLN